MWDFRSVTPLWSRALIQPLTEQQDESVTVATLQGSLQDVLQGFVEKQNLLPALGLPEAGAPLLRHLIERQHGCGKLHHAVVGLVEHKCTPERIL